MKGLTYASEWLKQNAPDYLLVATVVTLLLTPNANGICLILLSVMWLALNLRYGFIVNAPNKSVLYGLIALFVFLLIGLLYTEDLKTGFRQIEIKIGLFAFPVIFLFTR